MAFNPDMLQVARESRALTQTDLAEAAGFTQGYISKIERGDAVPSDEQVEKIASALNYPSSFFTQAGRIGGLGISFIYYRKRANTPVQEIKKIQADVNIRRMALATLLHEVNISTRSRFEKMDIDEYAGNAEKIAALVRASWGLPLGPVNSLIAAIESAGGIVFAFSFGTKDIDALSQWPDGLAPLFFVNSDVPADRWRFSLAHELGHIIMHDAATDDMEGEANRFASEFLMPAKEITPYLRVMSMERAANLKPVWRVSMAAIIKRSYDLKQITESQYRRLFTQLSASGYRKHEPVSIRPESPTLVPQIVAAYQQSTECGISDVCRVVHLFEEDFRQRFIPETPVLRIAR